MGFLEDVPTCPALPVSSEVLRASSMKVCGKDRGGAFYLKALECGQSLWRQGLPAQAILMLNRAFSADLRGDEVELLEWPLPYQAMRYILENSRDDWFLGNPRRHFQHLATRMVEPRRDLRSWRAWACWWIAREVLPDQPADDKQLEEEGIVEPTFDQIFEALQEHGLEGESLLWKETTTTRLFPES